MAITVVLQGALGVAPLETGGKQIRVYHEQSDTEYLIPMETETTASMVKDLSASNKELAERIEKLNE